jgi:hypothetical protein
MAFLLVGVVVIFCEFDSASSVYLTETCIFVVLATVFFLVTTEIVDLIFHQNNRNCR